MIEQRRKMKNSRMPARRLKAYLRKDVLLVTSDIVICTAAFYIALRLRLDSHTVLAEAHTGWTLLRAIVYATTMLLGLIAMGSYPDDPRGLFLGISLRIGASFLLGNILLAACFFIFPVLSADKVTIFLAQYFSLVGITIARTIAMSSVGRNLLFRRLLVLGAGPNAQNVLDSEQILNHRGSTIAGFVSMSGNNDVLVGHGRTRITGLTSSLVRFADQHHIDEIIVAMDERRGKLPLDQLVECKATGIKVTDVAAFFEKEFGRLRLDLISPSYLIFSDGFNFHPAYTFIKRFTDLTLGAVAFLIVSPLMAITALAIFCEDGWGSPVIYRQSRVGEHGKVFTMLKFRSMRPDAEADKLARWARPNDDRITRVGSLIRRHRIDELPQIFNVLRGDMSFVGPRPERPEFVDKLMSTIPYYGERHRVKVGITGWAQLCYPYGASEKDAAEKLQYDLYYTKNRNFFLDVLILLKTVEVVFFGKGAR